MNTILGRLADKYDVELSPLEGASASAMPIGINLKDKNVEVPLSDWGSGTQNRTHILMAILRANRIRTTEGTTQRITPLVLIEEPESFLHPSAQSEFGRLLRALSTEFGIQIIVTTHSPYMLNQETPTANILLSRMVRRRKLYEAFRVDTAEENWMAPFADHLGINASEFDSWRPVFSSYKSRVLLVEGPQDKEYFEYFKSHGLEADQLVSEIEVVPYGGKDTLKNTLLLQFVLAKFDRVFITYDLDAAADVRASLRRLGLKDGEQHIALGQDKSGLDSIEGLLPDSVLSLVNGRETDLVMQLRSTKSDDRRSARSKLKARYLEEFKSRTDYSREDLRELSKAVKTVNQKLCGTK